MLLFTDTDLQRDFPSAYLKRGRDYQASGRVRALKISDDGRRLAATVQGGAKRPYRTDIALTRTRKGIVRIEGSCSCPMVYNCKHVAATLLEALEQRGPEDSEEALAEFEPAPVAAPARPAPNHALRNWLDGVTRAARGVKPASRDMGAFYFFAPKSALAQGRFTPPCGASRPDRGRRWPAGSSKASRTFPTPWPGPALLRP